MNAEENIPKIDNNIIKKKILVEKYYNKKENYDDLVSEESKISENDTITNEDNIPDVKDIEFTSKETYYFKMVDKFFKSASDLEIKNMLKIIEGLSNISLRLLDWFVTRYANKHKTSYEIDDDGETFPVYISYKAQLKSYRKRYFDPFRRRKKFYYYFKLDNKKEKFITTIGQLNFFRWAFCNKVIGYVEKNFDHISKAMVMSNKDDKERKKKLLKENKNNSKKNTTLKVEKSGIKTELKKNIKNDNLQIVVSFD